MYEKRITIGCAVSIAAWSLAGTMLLVLWATGDVRAGFTATAAMGIAVTFTIRGFMENRCIELRNAFDLGRDSMVPTPLLRR